MKDMKATDWNLRINNLVVAHIGGMQGPRDFVNKSLEQELLGPNGHDRSNFVTVACL